VVMTNRHI